MRPRIRAVIAASALLAPALITDRAWAAASISPTSGPSGTQIRVTDAECRNQDNNVISFGIVASERVGGELVARSPQGGSVVPVGVRIFGSSEPSVFAISGPPGQYTLQASCRSLSVPFTERSSAQFRFDLTGEGSPPAATQPAATAPAAPSSAAPAPVAAPAAAPGGDGTIGRREAERNAELALRDIELAARDREIAQREIDRNAELAARDRQRNAEIAQRDADRNAELAARDRELAQRNAEADSR